MLSLYEKCTKKHCFFGPSIWKGFWWGTGRVLGGQNPRFSHFFRYFFVVVFEARFGWRKNRPKMQKNQTFPLFGVGFAVYGTCLGRDYREGKHEILMRHLQQGLRCWCLVFDVAVDDGGLARPATPSVGGGSYFIEDPRGGTAAHPPFGKSWLRFDVGVRRMGNSSS